MGKNLYLELILAEKGLKIIAVFFIFYKKVLEIY